MLISFDTNKYRLDEIIAGVINPYLQIVHEMEETKSHDNSDQQLYNTWLAHTGYVSIEVDQKPSQDRLDKFFRYMDTIGMKVSEHLGCIDVSELDSKRKIGDLETISNMNLLSENSYNPNRLDSQFPGGNPN